MALFLHKPQICSHLARREEPAAVAIVASVAAGVQESCSVSASWRTHRHMQARSAHAGSVGASWDRGISACRLDRCMQAGFAGCMHSRLLSWRRTQTFNARDGPTKPRPNGRTATPPNATQSSVAPLVRVNGQAFDPTATSVVPSYEGSWQGSGEN